MMNTNDDSDYWVQVNLQLAVLLTRFDGMTHSQVPG